MIVVMIIDQLIKPCSRCGEINQKTEMIRWIRAGNKTEKRYRIKCRKCGFKTDDYRTRREAVRTWNEGQMKFPE